MFVLASVRARPAFREGMRSTLGVAPGIAAWGLMTGVAMVKSGMSVIEAVAMTLFVYAGSSQLASIPLIVAGAPPGSCGPRGSASTCASWCSACTCGST